MIDRTRLVVRDNPRIGFIVTGQFISGMYHTWGRRPVCRECGEPIRLGDVARWDMAMNRPMTEDGTEIVHSRCKPYEGRLPRADRIVDVDSEGEVA